jgi:hypothetical protein
MNLALKLTKNKMILKESEFEDQTKTAVGIGRFLIQKILRSDEIEKLIEDKCHGACFTTLKNNEVSNSILMDVTTRRKVAFLPFMIVGRAESLPTPANRQPWFHDQQEGGCRRSQENKKPTFGHAVNECPVKFQLMTQ